MGSSSEKKEEMKFVPYQEGKGNKTMFDMATNHTLCEENIQEWERYS